MDIFALREGVVSDYRRYVESFVRIRDERIDQHVKEQFDKAVFWPDSILQLNPAYEPGPTLDELAAQGVILPATADFFRRPDGKPLRLYRHQHEAMEAAGQREPYLVTTGTGSGKTLAYLIPIYDHIVRNSPEQGRVRAVIVYPMNALINSQYEALTRYTEQMPSSPVRFEKYTGQERNEVRQRILDNPPHILLTNYVMLEYMLLRPTERHFFDRTLSGNVEFLVIDELHTYRGRQGADVAMLIRRLRDRMGNPNLLCVGTSATLVSGGTRDERRAAAAATATQLFGVTAKPENVIDESLRRVVEVQVPGTEEELRAAVEAPLPPQSLEGIRQDPLAGWIEETFGVAVEDGRLVRRTPITFDEGVNRLSEQSGLPEETCRRKLQDLLALGNGVTNEENDPVFAFRLHQFLAGGGAVYASLQPSADRYITLEGQQYGPDAESRLYPLAFCRECGQEYYMVVRRGAPGSEELVPDEPFLEFSEAEENTTPGYFMLDAEEVWSTDKNANDLPDHWYQDTRAGRRLKRDYRQHVPQKMAVSPIGLIDPPEGATVEGWFQPKPFMLCLRCGIAYERIERNDFRKLMRLSHTGRSTSTTVVATSTAVRLKDDPLVPQDARKLLSFTDNRQDASLQAGHFNDFVQVALVRAALYRALRDRKQLDHAQVARAVFDALSLPQELYAKAPAEQGPGRERNEEVFRLLLEYRLYEDLRRGWRIIQPNLEQCGLLRMRFEGLEQVCADPSHWTHHPLLAASEPPVRERVVRAFLSHLLRDLALDVHCLQPAPQDELWRRVQQTIKEPWTFEEGDTPRQSRLFVLPGQGPLSDERERSLGATTRVGRFLRVRERWALPQDLSPHDYEELLRALAEALKGQFLVLVPTVSGEGQAVQVITSCLRWQLGDGTPAPPDPVRTRWAPSARMKEQERQANQFFASLYQETAQHLAGVEGREHTAQVPFELRQDREERFREGKLSALFCSPTMELGIDIVDLNVVHMRNVPPTPANYAQRSGRAGRGGRPALAVAFCGEGNAHDQYFFGKRQEMVSGTVAPARLDLGNGELVKAHIHSVWLAAAGLNLGHSMRDMLDLAQEPRPLNADMQQRLQSGDPGMARVKQSCQSLLDACGESVTQAPWYAADWLDQVLGQAPIEFDRAFDRWRELHASAVRQRDDARKVIDNSRDRRERREAERRETEAKRQLELLLNEGGYSESDFYPYRYLASEGFIPGYNFPRLPVRAMLPYRETQHNVDRARFLALGEFGPRNIMYHEGRKYRLDRCILPPGGLEHRLATAKICNTCGYFHEGQQAGADRCERCDTELDGARSEYLPALFEMTAVSGTRVERITCDEEERVRQGFHITTHYRFARGPDGRDLAERAVVAGEEGRELMRLIHAPQAALWRVNHKWRNARDNGFAMDAKTGYWARNPAEDDHAGDIEGASIITGIRPFVRDTRNLLLVSARVAGQLEDAVPDEAFLASLGAALERGIQEVFQVEEREIVAERIGAGAERRLLLWEAAEGGTGVWPRLMEDARAIAQVAAESLRICHFDPEKGEDYPEACSRACYRCLLSYVNQRDHALLDRRVIKDYLLALAGSTTSPKPQERPYEEQYQWLRERLDRESSLEAAFLDLLFNTRRRLPDRAQYRPEEHVYAEADFYYERAGIPGVAVFCDGPDHDQPDRKRHDETERARLADLGYRVIAIRYDEDLEAQLARNGDVFGPGQG
jgi:ATP-dependent helicase YprA (DUF1998 family)